MNELPVACNGCPQDFTNALCGVLDHFTIHMSPGGIITPAPHAYTYDNGVFSTVVNVNGKLVKVTIQEELTQEEKTARHNMNYLQLNREQYDIHCKITGNMGLMTPGMRTYCEQQSKIMGFSGDAFCCWVAEYIKAHPDDVAHLKG